MAAGGGGGESILHVIGYNHSQVSCIGGRIAMYFQYNKTSTLFSFRTFGGLGYEVGGSGTAFAWHLLEEHRTLWLDNHGRVPLGRRNNLRRTVSAVAYTSDPDGDDLGRVFDYTFNDFQEMGGRTFLLSESGDHHFANNSNDFHFEEFAIFGAAQLVIFTPGENADIFFREMIGDRTGVMHVHGTQEMDLSRPTIDLPFSLWAYDDSNITLAPFTEVHGVFIQMAGELRAVDNTTIHHGGRFHCNHGGHTEGEPEHVFHFENVIVQDEGLFEMETHPVDEPGINLTTYQLLKIEGGGEVRGTFVHILSPYVQIDMGGILNANGFGYHELDTIEEDVFGRGLINAGQGQTSADGASGASHGGTGGRGNSQNKTRFSYNDLYEPRRFGSAGGAGASPDSEHGARGGGVLWVNVTVELLLDGQIAANGVEGERESSGGGSGGSIWVHAELIKGRGNISTHGGDGHENALEPGGGGAGGRVALYIRQNETSPGFHIFSCGGKSAYEAGGPGTGFVWHETFELRTLIVDNCGLEPRTKKDDLFRIVNAIELTDSSGKVWDYTDLTEDAGHAWILPESAAHRFASFNGSFHFEEFEMWGNAHLAFLADPVYANLTIFSHDFHGDRTGTLHLAGGQDMDLEREEISVPFNVWAYSGSHLGLAKTVDIHSVFIQMYGRLSHVHNMTIHREGDFWANDGGATTGLNNSEYYFQYLTIADAGQFHMETHPIDDVGIRLETIGTYVEGGAEMRGAKVRFHSKEVRIDDGGTVNSDGLGYHTRHGQGAETIHGIVNIGRGHDSASGASGGGHGGSAGRGGVTSGQTLVGAAYGDFYEPYLFGSAGGSGEIADPEHGGRGGGIFWFNISDILTVDGEIRASGTEGQVKYSGGGSGGSIWINCNRFHGTGNVTSHGGAGYFHVDEVYGTPQGPPNYSGGGGGGGRVGIYFFINDTFTGRIYAAGGPALQDSAEAGGPGTAFVYHEGEEHRTLIVDNDNQYPWTPRIEDYSDLRRDGARAWLLSESGIHDFANNSHQFHFEELQIYGGAHLAIETEPLNQDAELFFINMIGDRTGVIHIGYNQTMDLERNFLDAPFSCYVYEGGYYGMATFTDMDGVFVMVEGEIDHIVNLTLIHGATLYWNVTGGSHGHPNQTLNFNGTVRVKADSSISALSPLVHPDPFRIEALGVVVEGGGLIDSTFLQFFIDYFTIDDGGVVNASSRGYNFEQGSGFGHRNPRGSSGAGHGGRGGRGSGFGGQPTWQLDKGEPYGNYLVPKDWGSGGGGEFGSIGGGRLEFYVDGIMHVDGLIAADAYDVFPDLQDGVNHLNLMHLSRTYTLSQAASGGGFEPVLHEFLWYIGGSSWRRYSDDGVDQSKTLSFSSSSSTLWVDPLEGITYVRESTNCIRQYTRDISFAYTASDRVCYGSQTVGGIWGDVDYLYVMFSGTRDVQRYSKTTMVAIDGVEPIRLLGGRNDFTTATLNGGLVVVEGKIYHAMANSIYRYDLATGYFDNSFRDVDVTINAVAFDGQDICISGGSGNREVYCYRVIDANSFKIYLKKAAGGGSGGSIYCEVGAFVGGHTVCLQLILQRQ
jgi:hypothetical protein